MADATDYTPPKVWTWKQGEAGGRFANINRPVAGPTHDKELPVGRHPLQLYSLATPNGQKVTILLEELLALGHRGAEYDAWLIKIGDGDQFGSRYGDSATFLSAGDYTNVRRWAEAIDARPAVKRGRMVNRVLGDPAEQLRERHDASDFTTRTEDKVAAE